MYGKIVELNDRNNTEVKIREMKDCMKGPSVILIWAVWCPHCQIMKPDWDMVKPDMVRQGIHVIEIESSNLDRIRQSHQDVFKKLYKKNDAVMFPTIQMHKKNDDKKTVKKIYDGKRDFETMRANLSTHFKVPSKKKVSKSKSMKQKGGNTELKKQVQSQSQIKPQIQPQSQSQTQTKKQSQIQKEFNQFQSRLDEFIKQLLEKNDLRKS